MSSSSEQMESAKGVASFAEEKLPEVTAMPVEHIDQDKDGLANAKETDTRMSHDETGNQEYAARAADPELQNDGKIDQIFAVKHWINQDLDTRQAASKRAYLVPSTFNNSLENIHGFRPLSRFFD